MVAHNAIIGRAEYDRIVQLVGEVSVHLQEAVENLDKIHVPTEDREQLAENVVSSINVLSGISLIYGSYSRRLLPELPRRQVNPNVPYGSVCR